MHAGLRAVCLVFFVAGSLSGCSNAKVVDQVVTIDVQPVAPQLRPGDSVTFVATVSGSSDRTVSWAVAEPQGGTVDANGRYTAPGAAGSYHVVATSVPHPSAKGTATITVTSNPAVQVVVLPHTADVFTGAKANFTAVVTGANDTTVTWSVQEGSAGGSVTSGGLYSAPAAPGSFHVVATSNADSTKSDSATITVSTPGPVMVSPKDPTVMVGGTVRFSCAVSLAGDSTFTWSIQEGAAGGTITSAGLYTAPSTAGSYHVVCTARADATKTDTATARVVPTGAFDTWTNVTPSGIDLTQSNPDNFGIQDVLADPARPGDFYAFTCYQGVWKSSDYGQTWSKVSNGTLPAGKHWSAAIDKDSSRNPGRPPALWTLSGNSGVFGVFKSTDGGSSWTHYSLPVSLGQDGYSLDVDPYDSNHLLLGFHESAGLAESTDGGATWNPVALASGMAAGQSWYPFFIDTGTATGTRGTWLLLPQPTGGLIGTWRTANAGTTWARVETNEHPHGNAQIFQANGVVFMGGVYGSGGGNGGVYRSTDLGATWLHVGNLRESAIVYGTSRKIYAQYAWANSGGVSQSFSQRADYPGTTWTDWPLTMSNGPKRAGVSFDGTHSVIVGGNWLAGMWRYVEP
jgi:hypothetical protein